MTFEFSNRPVSAQEFLWLMTFQNHGARPEQMNPIGLEALLLLCASRSNTDVSVWLPLPLEEVMDHANRMLEALTESLNASTLLKKAFEQ